jgi:hypothetical protein
MTDQPTRKHSIRCGQKIVIYTDDEIIEIDAEPASAGSHALPNPPDYDTAPLRLSPLRLLVVVDPRHWDPSMSVHDAVDKGVASVIAHSPSDG